MVQEDAVIRNCWHHTTEQYPAFLLPTGQTQPCRGRGRTLSSCGYMEQYNHNQVSMSKNVEGQLWERSSEPILSQDRVKSTGPGRLLDQVCFKATSSPLEDVAKVNLQGHSQDFWQLSPIHLGEAVVSKDS